MLRWGGGEIKSPRRKESFVTRRLAQALLIPRQRPVSASLMLDHGAGIAGLLGLGGSTATIGVVQRFVALHGGGQLRQPFADVVAVGVVAFALEQGVKDPEIRLRVDARGGAKSPAAVVGREVAVDESFHKVALAQAPVEKQVFGQEGGDCHAGAVVHVTGVIQLPHGGVDEGVAGSAVAPRFEIAARVFPGYVGVLGFERFVHA